MQGVERSRMSWLSGQDFKPVQTMFTISVPEREKRATNTGCDQPKPVLIPLASLHPLHSSLKVSILLESKIKRPEIIKLTKTAFFTLFLVEASKEHNFIFYGTEVKW